MFKLAFLLLGCFAFSSTYSSAVPYNWAASNAGCQSCNTPSTQSTWPNWSGWPNSQNWWSWPSWQNQYQTQWQYPSQQQWNYPSQQNWQYPSYQYQYQWPQVPTVPPPTVAPTAAPTVAPKPPTPVDYAVEPAPPTEAAAAAAGPVDAAAAYVQPFTGPTQKAKNLKEGGGVRGVGSAASSIPFWWALNWCFMPSNTYTMPCRCLFSYIEYCWMEPNPHPLCKCENTCKWW
ncbi:uncharacterized protein LOC143911642 [Arctopsyche grandis]|uniref:uncharacterized protein LOC143911642 n=1 Tax=Arctopsyche grandis TaxID=121162 RepID=UPI00406D675F